MIFGLTCIKISSVIRAFTFYGFDNVNLKLKFDHTIEFKSFNDFKIGLYRVINF